MKVLIAGMGLIGGSFALALRDRGIADEILGVESSEGNAAEALRLGLADRIVAFEEGIPQADLVVLATPVDTIPLMAVKALNRVNGSQVVMDLGSIKAELCEVISMHARRGRFVAVHPMWGTEYSGPRAAQHGAFTGRNVVLCEVERSDPDALAMAERIFRTLEAPAVYMGAEEHDLHAAYVSHISHITSFALALTVLEKEREERHIFDLAGGGFESTVRLAKSSAATWVPIMLRNKYNLLDVLREHIHQLQIMRQDDRARRRRRAEGRLRPGQLDPAHHPLTGMSTTAETGRAGERAAAEYLRRAGYEICALNWRSGRYELDIVARKAGIVHFVEVKTRRAGSLTPPEAAVTPQKFRALTRAAVRYLAATGGQDEAQFDLAAVDVMPDGHMEVRLVEQAMEYNW